ncbi:MAG: DUF2279 domain-containing protein [Gemmatimonadetes bacterium]|jgi:hypothetical protein|nr:DUF2279 domain-containing protein [Gemmatimonadota bacterium]MBT4612555.1 DUF2279 domain-containing protein [Gemmatimonadota bacterium]MBT5145253.1 DUF2279 domain-containing protein [Gemmatimonadota bacterium]MBT5965309.1 DUF2279 domain-containing protein [Gemmatimonadota bacterium]MBT7455019.1 DUF2279 domain-containing protein [Gemmatimonadota bacterium]
MQSNDAPSSCRVRLCSLWLLSLLLTAIVWGDEPTAATEKSATDVASPVSESKTSDAEQNEPAGLRPRRLAALGSAGVAAHYVGFRYFDRAWYQGEQRGNIRWLQDWSGNTYLHVDKGGHFMSGIFLSQSVSEAFTWTGITPRKAAVLGAMTSWGLLFEIEMRDAYFDQWGFSVPDFLANTAGVSVPLLHSLVPSTRIVDFKFSWFPSPLYRDYDARLAADLPRTRYAIDDYEGMTFWMTFAMNDVLRGRAKEVWPDWLGLALGYGATGMHGANVKSRGREREFLQLPDARGELVLSLDTDARYLPGDGEIWSLFKEQLNWLHLPAPAIRLYPTLRFYLLYL